MKTVIFSIILLLSQVIASLEAENLEVGKELYPFESHDSEVRFNRLLEDYRCPKCQSSNLAGSNAPIAKDLKLEIYRLVRAGKKDSEITEFLTQRYGDFILYKPPFQSSTYVLWIGPFILLFLAMLLVLAFKRNQQNKGADRNIAELKKQLEFDQSNK
tara:strand:+ start:1589 stop:2062 length:474 start_codon:yes stop_codon:yes gene_type:complete